MKRSDQQALMSNLFKQCEEMYRGKNGEYASEGDALENFKEEGRRSGLDPRRVLWIYLQKHMSSINNYIKDAETGRQRTLTEPILGRVQDVIVYMTLFAGLDKDLQQERLSSPPQEAQSPPESFYDNDVPVRGAPHTLHYDGRMNLLVSRDDGLVLKSVPASPIVTPRPVAETVSALIDHLKTGVFLDANSTSSVAEEDELRADIHESCRQLDRLAEVFLGGKALGETLSLCVTMHNELRELATVARAAAKHHPSQKIATILRDTLRSVNWQATAMRFDGLL